MGWDLEEQHVMVEDVEGITDRVSGKVQQGVKRVGWVIKQNEGESIILSAPLLLIDFHRQILELLYCSTHIRPHPAAHTSLGLIGPPSDSSKNLGFRSHGSTAISSQSTISPYILLERALTRTSQVRSGT